MKRFLLFAVLVLAFFPIADAQTWPNFGGDFYDGSAAVDLYLVTMETPWSIPEYTGSYWEATIVGDGATVQLCRNALWVNGESIGSVGCVDLVWTPSAHAYTSTGIPHSGYIDVTILVVTHSIVQLIEGRVVEGSEYYFLCVPPYWEWVHVWPNIQREIDREEYTE